MVNYQINGVIENSDDPTLLSTMDWFAVNYASAITAGKVNGQTKQFSFTLLETIYTNVGPIISNIKTQFTTDLSYWEVILV